MPTVETAEEFTWRCIGQLNDAYMWIEHEGAAESDGAQSEGQKIIASLVEQRDAAVRAEALRGSAYVVIDELDDSLSIEMWNGERKVTAWVRGTVSTLIRRAGDETKDADDVPLTELGKALDWLRSGFPTDEGDR